MKTQNKASLLNLRPRDIKHTTVIGQRYGKLEVIGEVIKNNKRQRACLCRCDCGVEKLVEVLNLAYGHTKSCGCHAKERARETAWKHKKHGYASGGRLNQTYHCWVSMRYRCRNPKCKNYKNYGGRGITVCQEWSEFKNFLQDMGDAPKGHQIDRINVNGNYEKCNCRWVTTKVQSDNKRSTKYMVLRGIKKTMTQWSVDLGVEKNVLNKRKLYGWTDEKALTTPVAKRTKRKMK